MKKLFQAAAVAAAMFVLSACATQGGAGSDIVPMAGVMKLTEQLAEGDPERAERVRRIATEIRIAAGNEEFATVDLLIKAIRAKVQWDRLSPVDTAIAEELLVELRRYLVAELGEDVLPEHLRLSVEKVSGWVVIGSRG